MSELNRSKNIYMRYIIEILEKNVHHKHYYSNCPILLKMKVLEPLIKFRK